MFLGRLENTIDEKGRITFPTRFREILSDGAVITKGFDQNLLIMPSSRWNILSDNIKKLSITDANARTLKRQLYSLAAEIVLDSAGRFIIPPSLRNEAHLSDSATYVCVGDDIELWNPDLLAQQDKIMEDPELQAKRYEAFDLTIS
ncbi:MAG: division/cell wall cluster transcriptional repressor MraZ [Anaerolineaceae bacterium]